MKKQSHKFRFLGVVLALLVCCTLFTSVNAKSTVVSKGSTVPFYAWQLGGIYDDAGTLDDAAKTLGITHVIITTDPKNIEWLLENFQTAGLHLVPQLAKWDDYTDSDGNFDFDAWQEKILAFKDLYPTLKPFIKDGTFAGVLLLDDLGNFTDGGPSAATLDKMAKVVRDVFKIKGSNFQLIVRDDPSAVLERNGYSSYPFRYVNRLYIEITAVKVDNYAGGDLKKFIKTELIAAKKLKVPAIMGINLLDYNSTSSSVCSGSYAGTRWDRCAATPSQISEVGAAMKGKNKFGVAVWKITSESAYDFALEDSGYVEALRNLVGL